MSALSASSVRVAVSRHVGGREKLIEQRRVADDRARVGQREQELRVVGLEAGAFVHLADVMADRQPEIPQRIQEGVQEALVRRPDRAGEEHQQIDVRVQAQLAAAVAAEREDRHRLRRRRRRRRTAAGRARPCGASTAAAPGVRPRRARWPRRAPGARLRGARRMWRAATPATCWARASTVRASQRRDPRSGGLAAYGSRKSSLRYSDWHPVVGANPPRPTSRDPGVVRSMHRRTVPGPLSNGPTCASPGTVARAVPVHDGRLVSVDHVFRIRDHAVFVQVQALEFAFRGHAQRAGRLDRIHQHERHDQRRRGRRRRCRSPATSTASPAAVEEPLTTARRIRAGRRRQAVLRRSRRIRATACPRCRRPGAPARRRSGRRSAGTRARQSPR